MPFDYFSKLWLKKNANELAIRRATELMEGLGCGLPCTVTAVSGQMVTVQWTLDTAPWTLPPVTIPCAGQSPWNYRPTQVGDTGITVPMRVLLGQIIGTSTSATTFAPPGNLSALVFLPVGTKSFVPPDANAYLIQGPNGFIGRTTTGTASSVVTNSNGTTVTYGSDTVTLNSNGLSAAIGSTSISVTGSAITLTAGGKTLSIDSGGITIDGILFETHEHAAGTYVAGTTAVTGDSGVPV